jgi:branched-chain amino acid transport system permease protein
MKIFSVRNFWIFLLLVALLFPMIYNDKFLLNILILILIYATIATAWNILGGYGGQLSLGHAIFFGLGAYTSSILYLDYGISPWIGFIIGAIVAIFAGVLIGWPTFRLKGTYFTLATIAFAEVLRYVALFWRDLTNGSVGINIRFEPSFENMIFREYSAYYYLILALFLITIGIVFLIERNKLGYYLKAIREDEDGAETLGINVPKYKMIAMIISAGITGIAGVFYAQYLLFFNPTTVFNLNFSIEIAMIAIIGGMGTVFGPLLGAIIVVPLSEFLRSAFPMLNGLNFFVYGIILILIVSFMPNGLLPIIKEFFNKLNRKTKSVEEIRRENQVDITS